VVDQAAEPLRLDPLAINPVVALMDAGANFPSDTFADYYDFVEAIDDETYDDARAAYNRLCAAKPGVVDLSVVSLGDPALCERALRYKRMMNADPSLELGFVEPPNDLAAAFQERLERGWKLLDAGLPELSAEIRGTIREVVIAGSDPTKKYQFDGGSHYRLWGALFLNCQYHPDDIAICEVLAHESAHSLLFGFCTHEPLVLNDEEDLYASPLRVDPRPMDGIYHATFVSARMHWAMTKLASSGVLDAQQQEQARAAAAADAVNFDAGYGVVAEHGVLTPIGKALMDGAHGYMQSVR
ncbi:MAG: HEXXH motif domain-containing protein, partial [Hyphomicrobiales bacterium]